MGTAGGPLRGARAPHSRHGCAHCRHRAGPWPDAGYQEHGGLSGVREVAPKSLDVATDAFSRRAASPAEAWYRPPCRSTSKTTICKIPGKAAFSRMVLLG